MSVTMVHDSEVDSSSPQANKAPTKHIDMNGNEFLEPNFTIKEIYDAIPKHCFKSSTVHSMGFVVRDYCYLAGLIYVTHTFTPMVPYTSVRALIYAAQTIMSGMIMTGIWILAHECGHGAFSSNKNVNNIMGWLMHSFLLVPYHSWRISHSHHHKATGNLQREVVFVPHDRESWLKKNHGPEADPHDITFAHLSEDAPLTTLFHCLVHQLIGWPGYLLFNLSGQQDRKSFPKHSHYWFGTDSAIFKGSETSLVLFSDIGLTIMARILHQLAMNYGWWNVIVYYGIPYLWVNHWIVLITYLQHTDGSLPHYDNSKWTFARGATATIDRDFGWIDTHLFHRIISTHVCHHLVSSIPHYHAVEATEAIKEVMGPHYRADLDTPMFSAFWQNQRDCKFVEETTGADNSGIFFFRNLHGRGTQPRDLAGGEKSSTWRS